MTKKKSRKNGYYWVRFRWGRTWTIALWERDVCDDTSKVWTLCESTCNFSDDDFDKIDERRIVREEPN